MPNAPCRPVRSRRRPAVCWFGERRAQSTRSVALVGDSHAPAWRAAVAVVARRRDWHGLTVQRPSCPFAHAQPEASRASGCRAFVRDTRAWLRRHREVDTVLLGMSASYDWSRVRGGFEAAVASIGRQLAALPSSVRHVVVLRDSPRAEVGTLDCVGRAVRERRPPGPACALDRARALWPDAAVEAARRSEDPRVSVVDLTPFFCDEATCLPVVGGALVFKDVSHITSVFAATLGPYLARQLPAGLARRARRARTRS